MLDTATSDLDFILNDEKHNLEIKIVTFSANAVLYVQPKSGGLQEKHAVKS